MFTSRGQTDWQSRPLPDWSRSPGSAVISLAPAILRRQHGYVAQATRLTVIALGAMVVGAEIVGN